MKEKRLNCRIFWLISISVGILLVLSPYSSEGKTDFPTKPIEILCGYGAGGSTDTTIRAISKAAEKYTIPVFLTFSSRSSLWQQPCRLFPVL